MSSRLFDIICEVSNHFDINADGIENLKDFAEFAQNWLWQAQL